MKLPKQPLDPQAKLLSLHYSSDLYFGDLLVILTTQSTIFFKSVVTLTKLEFSANKTSYFIIDIKTEPQLFFKYLRQRCKRLKLSNNFSFGLLPPCHFYFHATAICTFFFYFTPVARWLYKLYKSPAPGLGIRSFQKNGTIFAFFSVLYKRTGRSLHSFPFFTKERNNLCVLFLSL